MAPETEDQMADHQTFWAAFQAGLAAPASLYLPPPSYARYIGNFGPAQSFAEIGMRLSLAVGRFGDESRQREHAVRHERTEPGDAGA
jgi:hypothetical protein